MLIKVKFLEEIMLLIKVSLQIEILQQEVILEKIDHKILVELNLNKQQRAVELLEIMEATKLFRHKLMLLKGMEQIRNC